jgi:GNAT superfamily N-acetyltransferase
MSQFVLNPCSIEDAVGLAKVHISAFWTDPTWVVIWKGKTLEYVTEQCARRMPHTLVLDATHRRHQKVIDTQTGAVVGYARWTLPELDTEDVTSIWPTARVTPVTEEKALEAEREFSAADCSFDHSLDELDKPIDEIMAKIMNERKYIGIFTTMKTKEVPTLTFTVLNSLAVIPDKWRQGIATMMLESGIKEIEKARLDLDILVRAKKAALGVYQRAGFRLIESIVQDALRYGVKEEYGAYFLVRAATKTP